MSETEELRARLSRLKGPARARPLLDLTQRLSDEYWRRGPGKPEALPLLDEAIASIDEAYGYFGTADPMRRNVAGISGWLHGSRHMAHFGPVSDRDIGIERIEEGLLSPNMSPMISATCQLTLGQLYMSSMTHALRSPDVLHTITSGGMPAGAAADVDKAAACFEQVHRTSGMPREVREVARTMLRLAGAMRTMVTGQEGDTGVDAINRMMGAMSVFQEIHKEQSSLLTVVPVGTSGAFYGADRIADQAPMDRPVPLVEVDDQGGRPAARPPRPRPRPAPAPVADPDEPAALRRELRARVSGGGDLFDALETMLDPAAAPPSVGQIDDVVALATAVVDAGAANRTDHLLYAVGLSLRARAAGARWVRRDLDEAADSLVRAADSPRPVPPEAVRVMRRVAAMVDALDPGCRAAARLADVLRGRGAGQGGR